MKLSIITTLYQSEATVDEFHTRITSVAGQITHDYEIVYVNDGSTDRSLDILLLRYACDDHIKIIDLSRNFGHHRALMTGLSQCQGDHVFLIDSDLEEAPELLAQFWEELASEADLDVVYGVQEKRKGKVFERLSGHVWYALFNSLSTIDYPTNCLAARLMTKRYVDAVIEYGETELELWGIFALAGFRQREVVASKSSKGSTTYTLRRKIRMAIDSVTSFSTAPLVLSFLLGSAITVFSMIYIIYLIIQKFAYQDMIEGWTSILVSIWLLGGLILFSIGVIGLYVSKLFLEVKRRPLTVIRRIYGQPK